MCQEPPAGGASGPSLLGPAFASDSRYLWVNIRGTVSAGLASAVLREPWEEEFGPDHVPRSSAREIGPYQIGLSDAAGALVARLSDNVPAEGATLDTVLFFVRLPRIAAAMLVGAGLAAAGAAYQGLFRNPLVSPDILGVSGGAGLGAVLGIFLSLPVVGIQLLAFVVGLGTVGLVLVIAASVRGREPVLVLVLAGVVVGALAGSAISLLKVLADPYDQLPAITFWLLGSLATIKLEDLATTVPVAGLGLVPLALLRWRINVLSLGDEEARALGIDAARLRVVVIAAATLMGMALAEGGRVLRESDPEVSEAVDFCELYSRAAEELAGIETIEAAGIGVVVVVPPWNFPIAIPCGGVAAALAAGNTVILKPAPATVVTAYLLCECFWAAGVPKTALL